MTPNLVTTAEILTWDLENLTTDQKSILHARASKAAFMEYEHLKRNEADLRWMKKNPSHDRTEVV